MSKATVTKSAALASISALGTAYGSGLQAKDDLDVLIAKMVKAGALLLSTIAKGKRDDIDDAQDAFFAAATKKNATLALSDVAAKTARSQFHAIAEASGNKNVDFPEVLDRTLVIWREVNDRYSVHQSYVNVAVAQKRAFKVAKKNKLTPVALSDDAIRAACTKKAGTDPTFATFLEAHKKALATLLDDTKEAKFPVPSAKKAELQAIVDALAKLIGPLAGKKEIDADRLARLEALERAENARLKAEAGAKEKALSKQALADAALAAAAKAKDNKRNGKRVN